MWSISSTQLHSLRHSPLLADFAYKTGKRSAISSGLGFKCFCNVLTISSKFLSAGFSGKSRSFNNEYVLLPIKLSRVGTLCSSSTSFAAKKCCTHSTCLPASLGFVKNIYFSNGWVDGWMGGWVDGWMGGWVDGWMGGWVDGWVDGGDGWMDGWMDGWHLAQFDGIWHNLMAFGTIWWHLAQFDGIWHNLMAFGTIWWHLAQFDGIWHKNCAKCHGIWHISVVYGTIGTVPWHLVQFRWHLAQFRWHFAQLSGYLVQYCTKCHFSILPQLQKHLAHYGHSRATVQPANITSFKKFLDQNLSIKIESLVDVTFDCFERHQWTLNREVSCPPPLTLVWGGIATVRFNVLKVL